MDKVSGVVICFNEEKCIERCILSLQNVCDEIVILDSFSTDRTAEICRQLGVRFYQRKFEGYGLQKRAAVSLASFDFILSLDADEMLDEELTHSILRDKKRGFYPLYRLNRKTFYAGKWVRHCGWYPDRKIRLWNRNAAEWTPDSLHETVQALNQYEKAHDLPGHILHYSYPSESDHIRQIRNFAKEGALKLFKQGRKANFYHLYVKPVSKFIIMYFFRLGFLDGFMGLKICLRSAYGIHQKYLSLRNLYLGK